MAAGQNNIVDVTLPKWTDYLTGALEPVSFSDGKPFQLWIAGSIVNRVGMECHSADGKHFLITTALQLENASSSTFTGAREIFEFDAEGRLLSIGSTSLTFMQGANGEDPPEAHELGGLACPGFEPFA